jgi:hypothetical protein
VNAVDYKDSTKHIDKLCERKAEFFYGTWSPRPADDIDSSTATLLCVLGKVFRTFRRILLPSSSGSSSQRTAAMRAESVCYDLSVNYVTLQGGEGVETFVTTCFVVGRGGCSKYRDVTDVLIQPVWFRAQLARILTLRWPRRQFVGYWWTDRRLAAIAACSRPKLRTSFCMCFTWVKWCGLVSVLASNSGRYFLEAIHFLVAWWGSSVCEVILEGCGHKTFVMKCDKTGFGVNFTPKSFDAIYGRPLA